MYPSWALSPVLSVGRYGRTVMMSQDARLGFRIPTKDADYCALRTEQCFAPVDDSTQESGEKLAVTKTEEKRYITLLYFCSVWGNRIYFRKTTELKVT
jgi:hypothetical protein